VVDLGLLGFVGALLAHCWSAFHLSDGLLRLISEVTHHSRGVRLRSEAQPALAFQIGLIGVSRRVDNILGASLVEEIEQSDRVV
jgi:hypothetical protein